MYTFKFIGTLAVSLLVLSACTSSGSAKPKFERNDSETIFTESEESLPAVPHAEQGDWYQLYVSPTFKGQPRILLSSIYTAGDGSIRYVFNNRSAAGYDNITAEAILCITGTKLLDSEGSKLKTFAYADTINQRWITPRKSEWNILGGSRNGTDQVRRVLYNSFCIDGKAKNDDELRQRVQHYGSSRPDY